MVLSILFNKCVFPISASHCHIGSGCGRTLIFFLQWMFDNQPMGEGAPPQLPVLEKSILQSEQRASSRQMRRKNFGFQALALRADMLALLR